MNSFERYLAVLRGEPADIVPRIPIVMQFAAEYIGSNYGAFASDFRVLVKANVKCANDFGIDQLSAISDPYRETHSFGGEIEYIPTSVPRCTAPLEENKELSQLLKPDPYFSTRLLDRIRAIESYNKNYGSKYSILGWIEGPAAEAACLRGVSNFLTDLMIDEHYVCELMDICVDVGTCFAIAQIDAGADTIGIGDSIASQVSEKIYEKYIQPREKKLIKAIQDKGAYTKLHICGDITHLLPAIADLNIDIIDIDHMVNMALVREKLGNKVVLSGNLDPASGLRTGKPEKIRQFILETYRTVGNPYMVNAGCEVPSGTSVENLTALCEPILYMD